MSPQYENIELRGQGPCPELLNSGTPEDLVAAVEERPELRGPLLRFGTQLQIAWTTRITNIAGNNCERLDTLDASDLAEVKRGTSEILRIAKCLVAVDNSPADDPYQSLVAPRLPGNETVAHLHQGELSQADFSNLMSSLPHIRMLEALQDHNRQVQAEASHHNVMQALFALVDQHGSVRFDYFHKLHQFGPLGFYSYQLNFAESGIATTMVRTPSNEIEGYAETIAENILRYSMAHMEEEASRGRNLIEDPIVVAEIGGGRGEFKQAFLERFDSILNAGMPAALRFISLDINHFQRMIQSVPGTQVREGSAVATGLANESVDIIFSEEVPDCFSHRWFRRDKPDGPITSEAHVVRASNFLKIVFEPVVRDAEVEEIEAHLLRHGLPHLHYKHSAQDAQFWGEMKRVLKPQGHCIMTDYTVHYMEDARNGMLTSLGLAINSPMNDITRGVDPLRMKALAETAGLKTRTMYFNLMDGGLRIVDAKDANRFFLSTKKE